MIPCAVLVHVPEVKAGSLWYQQAFTEAKVQYKSDKLTVLKLRDFSIEIVEADEKVGSGKNGTVLYWSVNSLTATVSHLQSLGATMYRGPMNIENNQSMCQIEDPFGNLIGLRGEALLDSDIHGQPDKSTQ